MDKVVVTGGGGFIGSNLAHLLLEEGYEVTVYDDFSSGYRSNVERTPEFSTPEFKVVEGDVRDAEHVAEVAAGASIIFHLAASVGNKRSIDHPREDASVNVLGTLNVLEAARTNGVGKVVYSSSAGIFGELRHLPIREDHPVEPDSPYGVSKLAAEKMCLAYAKLYDLEAVCLRYFNVYGRNQRYDAYGNAIPIFAHQMLSGELVTIFSDGEQTRDFVNVRDIARANLLAGRVTNVSGAFNIASGDALTVNELVALVAAISGREPTIVHGPPRKGDVRHSRADISAARSGLGYEPVVGLADGLTEYIDWLRTESALGPDRA